MSIICIVCRDLLTATSENDDQFQGAAALPPPGQGEEVEIVATKCGHLYHLHCLTGWFNTQGLGRVMRECPYCKTVVTLQDCLKVFPSGDEETDAIAADSRAVRLQRGQTLDLQDELRQVHNFLAESERKFEEESLNHDILKFEHAQKLSELDHVKREHDKLKECYGLQDASNKLTCDGLKKEIETLKSLCKTSVDDVIKLEHQYEERMKELEKRQKNYEKEIKKLKAELSQVQSEKESLTKKNQIEQACQTEFQDTEELKTRLTFFQDCVKYMSVEVQSLMDTLADRVPKEVNSVQGDSEDPVNIPPQLNTTAEDLTLNSLIEYFNENSQDGSNQETLDDQVPVNLDSSTVSSTSVESVPILDHTSSSVGVETDSSASSSETSPSPVTHRSRNGEKSKSIKTKTEGTVPELSESFFDCSSDSDSSDSESDDLPTSQPKKGTVAAALTSKFSGPFLHVRQ